MSAAQKGDVDGMTKLFSSKAIQRLGLDKIKSNNQYFADMNQKINAAANKYQMDDFKETREGNLAREAFIYHNPARTDSLLLIFDLSKEGSAWKIDDIGGSEKGDTPLGSVPPSASPTDATPPPAPSPPSEIDETPAAKSTNRAPISGGVLNGKAIELPKPIYPAAAKAAKASGTVTVQVTIDENGNVIDAHAVSGHPLLQAAAVTAARGARFTPTKLAGQPVKVTGVITYTFVAE